MHSIHSSPANQSKIRFLDIRLIGLLVPLTIMMGCTKRSPYYHNYRDDYLYNTQPYNYEERDADGYDKDGYDIFGYDRAGYNKEGFDIFGRDRDGYGRDGFDIHGWNREGFNNLGRNREGFDRNGFDIYGRDRAGYDRDGYNQDNISRNGRHRLEVELQANRIPTVDDFIRFAAVGNQANLQNKTRIATAIELNFDLFFDLHPTFQQVLQLLHQNGGFDNDTLINFSTGLKYQAITRNVVETGAQFAQIMGEIFPQGFQIEEYLLQNSLVISDLLIHSATRPQMTLADLNDLIAFIRHVELSQDVNRTALVAGLDRLIQARRAANQEQILPQLRARVLAKFNQAHPDFNGDIKFYLLRDPQTWDVNHADAENGSACIACLDDFDAQNRGLALRTREGHLVEGEQAMCQGCLIRHIRTKIGENQFPIRCPSHGHRHELPITAEFLRQGGFNENEIQLWEINTLRAYYRQLNGGNDGNHLCPTANCINVIFQEEAQHPGAPANHHVRCLNCEHEHCYNCQEKGHTRAHRGRTCADMDNPEWMDPRNRDMRPCPYCRAPFSKDGGCNAVHCERCDATFHYNNGMLRWSDATRVYPQFFHDFGEVVDRRYRLPGEDGYIPGGESAFEGKYPPLTQAEARMHH